MEETPERPDVFGAYLKDLRDVKAGLSLGQTLLRLRSLGIRTGKSTLSRYETGDRHSPDPIILWGLAQIYAEPLDRMIQVLVRARLPAAPKAAASPIQPRLLEDHARETRFLELFRALPAPTQREIVDLMEFKAERTRGGDIAPQPRAAVPSRSGARSRRSTQ